LLTSWCLKGIPRQAHIDAPGVLHHIVICGIERRGIFRDDKDRENFLERLSGLLQKSATPCYAWALRTNHVHLLSPTGPYRSQRSCAGS
jgi:putative transposase